jgi:hypothetical protein
MDVILIAVPEGTIFSSKPLHPFLLPRSTLDRFYVSHEIIPITARVLLSDAHTAELSVPWTWYLDDVVTFTPPLTAHASATLASFPPVLADLVSEYMLPSAERLRLRVELLTYDREDLMPGLTDVQQ